MIQPFHSLPPPEQNRRKQGTITKIYSGMRTMAVWFRATEIKKTRGSESVRKAGISMDNSLRSDNSMEIPKGRIQNLKFYYSPFRSHLPGIVPLSERLSK